MDQVFNIHHYHWFAYLFGFVVAPRLAIMIFFTIYFGNVLPWWLLASGWILGVIANVLEVQYINSLKEKKNS